MGSEMCIRDSLTGAGIDELIDKISDFLKEKSAIVGVASRDRHRTSLTRAIDHIETVRLMLVDGCDQTELLAEGVRSAIGALDSLIGQVGVEDILDEIFSSFCLGK